MVHAPRQTGKTTTLSALATELTAAGEYAALALLVRARATTTAPPSAASCKDPAPRQRRHEADPLRQGLAQLDGYLDRLSLDTGVLVIFDRRPQAAPIAHRPSFGKATSSSGRAITVLRA